MSDRRSFGRLAAALIVPALLLAACGGSTASTGPGDSVAPMPSDMTMPSDGSLPSFDIPSFAIPSFDLGSLVTNLENVDSYKVAISSVDGQAYTGTVVTKPVLARDLYIGTGDDATHVVTVGDQAWMGEGDGPLEPAPAILVSGLIPLFDPMILMGAFGGLSMSQYAQNLGEEEKNGQPTTHYRVDVASLPNFGTLGMPDSATMDTWVADDGYLVSFVITDFGTVGASLSIDITDVNDPSNVVETPS
jgi:hypothetical protein